MELDPDACFLHGRSAPTAGLTCHLKFRPPIAWDCLLAYLQLRAIPGVERVDGGVYRRTVAIDQHRGWISVGMAKSGLALRLELSPSLAPVMGAVLDRVKHLFDVGAVPDAVTSLLSQDPVLRASVERLPGLRVPGAFDGFELGVRAILGQQVSVKSATTVAGRWAHAFGESIETPFPALDRLTPGPLRMAKLTEDDIAALGVVGSRARCIVTLARAVNERRVVLSFEANVEAQIEALLQLPGIGPWTANYIAMRALHWADAFPEGDIMLLKAAKLGRKQLLAHAEHWRPWRAYATHYLWQSLGAFP